MDIPQTQNELSDIGMTATLVIKRIEQASLSLGLGDIVAKTELILAIEACDRVKNRLVSIKDSI
jgi:hypothetical protein